MKRLVGYHHQIKTILLPVLKDVKKIKTFEAGYSNEKVHVTFYDKSIWVLGHDNSNWTVQHRG